MIKIVESKATLMMGMNNMLNDISNDNGGDDKDNYINNIISLVMNPLLRVKG